VSLLRGLECCASNGKASRGVLPIRPPPRCMDLPGRFRRTAEQRGAAGWGSPNSTGMSRFRSDANRP
jgi:hypothetical protein